MRVTYPDVYVVNALRSPTGNRRGGGYNKLSPEDIGAPVVAELITRAGLRKKDIDVGALGCATQDAEQGFDLANRVFRRVSSDRKDFSEGIPSVTINGLCKSGAEAVENVAGTIGLGHADVGIAGGLEHNIKVRQGQDLIPFIQSLGQLARLFRKRVKIVNDSLPRGYPMYPMGKSGDVIAKALKVSREMADDIAAVSVMRTVEAQRLGKFDDEIVPIRTPYGVVKKDETVRADTNFTGLSKLEPSFGRKKPFLGIPMWPFTKFGTRSGTHTPGNSSPSGTTAAAALLLASRRAVEKHNWKPMAKLVMSGNSETNPHDPAQLLLGVPEAVQDALARATLRYQEEGKLGSNQSFAISDVDLAEVNEAFASVVATAMRMTGLDHDKTNVNGGAIALGHALGASGARIAVTGLHEMRRRNLEGRQSDLLLTAMCVGSGQGYAQIFENCTNSDGSVNLDGAFSKL